MSSIPDLLAGLESQRELTKHTDIFFKSRLLPPEILRIVADHLSALLHEDAHVRWTQRHDCFLRACVKYQSVCSVKVSRRAELSDLLETYVRVLRCLKVLLEVSRIPDRTILNQT